MKDGRGEQLVHGRQQAPSSVEAKCESWPWQTPASRKGNHSRHAELNRGWMAWGVRRVNTRGMDGWPLPHSPVTSCRPVEDR